MANEARSFKQIGLGDGTVHNPVLPLEHYKYFRHVITPDGVIKRMIPSIHGGKNEAKIINIFFDQRDKQWKYRLSTWAYDGGYRFLDEIADPDVFKEYLRHEEHYKFNPKSKFVPFPYDTLGPEVASRRRGQSKTQAPFQFSEDIKAHLKEKTEDAPKRVAKKKNESASE